MREIYIFDIDGCVMPPIFTNFNNNESRKKIIEDVIQNGNDLKLFPSFIEFYKRQCLLAESIYFITGRKSSEFGKLTESQLQILKAVKDFHVIYYPERKEHKIRIYFAWKVKEIRNIIKKSIKNYNLRRKIEEEVKFYIFDDMNEYFPKIKKIGNKWNIKIQLTMIESENDWNHLLK